jgi:hypothetical protein
MTWIQRAQIFAKSLYSPSILEESGRRKEIEEIQKLQGVSKWRMLALVSTTERAYIDTTKLMMTNVLA